MKVTRRNFIRSFGGLIAAVAVAQKVVAEVVVKAVEVTKQTLKVNPAWVNAPYELAFLYKSESFLEADKILSEGQGVIINTKSQMFEVKDGEFLFRESFPLRMDIDGRMVPPEIEA